MHSNSILAVGENRELRAMKAAELVRPNRWTTTTTTPSAFSFGPRASRSGLVSLAGTMARRGMGHAAIEAALLEENFAKCDPPLADNEIAKIAEWAAAKGSGDAAGAGPPGVEVPALKRAGLLGRADLHILYWSDAAATPWPAIVRASVKKAGEVGARMIVIDTVSQWAGFKGEEENSAGAALEALRPIQEASADGLAVIVVRHERKSGGVVGEAARGSSAFGGAPDIVISIRRPEGNTKPTLRNLQTLSRFDKLPPELVELTDHGYVIVDGDTADLAVVSIRTMLASSGAALTVKEMVDATGLKRTTVQDGIKRLVNEKLAVRLSGGVKGTPFRYALAKNAAGTSTPRLAVPAASVPEAVSQFAEQGTTAIMPSGMPKK